MWDRYHLGLALTALVLGLVVALVDRVPAPPLRSRAVAVAAALGALLGAWGSPRAWPWWVATAALVVPADDGDRPHPLGRWVFPCALASLAGVWSAVPDTEPALASAAALAPLAALRWWRGPVVGPWGSAALTVAALGSVWVGSAGWGAALAVVVAVGMVPIAPLAAARGRRPGRHRADEQPWSGSLLVAALGAHGVLALLLPRVVMSRPVPAAWAISIGALLTATALAVVASARAVSSSGSATT